MKNMFTYISFLTLLLVTHQAHAATFLIDPAYSVVIFKVEHASGGTIGGFYGVGGYLEVNPESQTIEAIHAKVDIKSIHTRNNEFDAILLSDYFFNAEKFPQATLVGKSIEDNKLTVDLTLRGKIREVVLDIQFGGVGKDPKGNVKVSLYATGKFNRNDFGIDWNVKLPRKTKLLGDEIELVVELEGALTGV